MLCAGYLLRDDAADRADNVGEEPGADEEADDDVAALRVVLRQDVPCVVSGADDKSGYCENLLHVYGVGGGSDGDEQASSSAGRAGRGASPYPTVEMVIAAQYNALK